MYILSVRVDKESANSRSRFFGKVNSDGYEVHTSDKKKAKTS